MIVRVSNTVDMATVTSVSAFSCAASKQFERRLNLPIVRDAVNDVTVLVIVTVSNPGLEPHPPSAQLDPSFEQHEPAPVEATQHRKPC